MVIEYTFMILWSVWQLQYNYLIFLSLSVPFVFTASRYNYNTMRIKDKLSFWVSIIVRFVAFNIYHPINIAINNH